MNTLTTGQDFFTSDEEVIRIGQFLTSMVNYRMALARCARTGSSESGMV